MPTYTYRCTRGHEFELQQSMSDPPRKRCPECRSSVKRIVHPVGVVLKGPGFHKTDYRSSSAAKKDTDGDKGSKDTSSDEGSKDTSTTSGKASSDTKGSSDTSKKNSSDD